jgi:hypothetical protein
MFSIFLHNFAFIVFRDSAVSHFQVLILVDLLAMQHHGFLEGGWVLVPCFPFAEGILKLEPLTMNPGPLGKRLDQL